MNYEIGKYKDLLEASRRILEGEDKVKGGLADKYSDEDLAKKHGVSVEEIQAQIAKGEGDRERSCLRRSEVLRQTSED
jgi:hypothetical protein